MYERSNIVIHKEISLINNDEEIKLISNSANYSLCTIDFIAFIDINNNDDDNNCNIIA